MLCFIAIVAAAERRGDARRPLLAKQLPHSIGELCFVCTVFVLLLCDVGVASLQFNITFHVQAEDVEVHSFFTVVHWKTRFAFRAPFTRSLIDDCAQMCNHVSHYSWQLGGTVCFCLLLCRYLLVVLFLIGVFVFLNSL